MPTVVDLNASDVQTANPQQSTGIVQLKSGADLVSQILGGGGIAEAHQNINETGQGAYIFNASDQSPNWPTQKSIGLTNGEFGLMDNGSMSKVTPMRYFLLYSEGFKTRMNKQGMLLGATQDMQSEEKDFGEHYIAVLLVEHEGKLVPAKGEFRYAKAPTVRLAVQKLKQALDPHWPNMGEKEKFAAQVQLPFARVYHEATVVIKTSRSGPMAGSPYALANVTSKPVDTDMLSKLQTALNDDTFKAKLQAVCNQYMSKVSEIKALCR